jgi:REP element-mobilizing transposase RayT
MPNTYSALYNHLVFSTKHREPNLGADVRPRLFAYMGGICRNIKCVLVGAGGVEDHIHLLVRRHPTVCESDLVRDVKANSSSWMKKFVPGFAWQDGGGEFTVGPQDIDAVLSYLATQEEHHRKEDFKTEYERFLKKYNIEYDPRYIFD